MVVIDLDSAHVGYPDAHNDSDLVAVTLRQTKVGVVLGVMILSGAALWIAWLIIRPPLIDVGGYQLEARVKGTGKPAVVVEMGFTGGILLYWNIQNRIAEQTRTLLYERAGLGRSDPGPQPRSAEQIARDLHGLLAAKAIAPPYILVGHSAGGLYVRVFAHMYPTEIAGLVLVDPAAEEDYERMQHDKSVGDLQKMGVPPGAVAQWRALPDTLDQARHSWPLPAVPVVVLTSGKPLGAWPLATVEDMQRWLVSHNQLVEKIPGAKHIEIQTADHLSILKEPVVTEEILNMMTAVRTKK
jgi:hypothetical protein